MESFTTNRPITEITMFLSGACFLHRFTSSFFKLLSLALNLFCKVFKMVFISWLQCFTVRLSGSHLFGNVLVHILYTWATRFPLHYRKAYLPPWGYISNKVPRSFPVYKRSDIFILAIYQFPLLLTSVKEVEDYSTPSLARSKKSSCREFMTFIW